MAMTIYDISKKAGVSIATVSRVLNGSENVRPSTRKKVMDVIDKYFCPRHGTAFLKNDRYSLCRLV